VVQASEHVPPVDLALAISGTTAVVGNPNVYAGLGAADVFLRTGSTWTQQAELVAKAGIAGDGFGSSVAIAGDYIIVGDPSGTVVHLEAGQPLLAHVRSDVAGLRPTDRIRTGAYPDRAGARARLFAKGTTDLAERLAVLPWASGEPAPTTLPSTPTQV
jgi:FG-GAP repeat